MRSFDKRFRPAVITGICLAVALLVGTNSGRTSRGPAQAASRGYYVSEKANPVISNWAANVIDHTVQNNKTHVWVYFTDKGFTDDAGLAAAASRQNLALTPAAATRRAKMGRNQIEFGDLPVRQDYIDQIVAAGGTPRQRSRWLNAASFEVDPGLLTSLSALPFVQKIDPVIGFQRPPEPELQSVPPGTGQLNKPMHPTAASGLNYGLSYDQLQQINVPAVHALGFKGQGVIVCMMDVGYFKAHEAFAQAYAEGRVLAEYDFIFHDSNTADQPADQPGQMSHGTLTWSTLGGEVDGKLYGPAYGAMFILAKTEDIRSEKHIEEDNWAAGVEWADSIGASVISSSLAYMTFDSGYSYTYADFNGHTAITTLAANHAAGLGIIVCNAMGNSGPSVGTLNAPADGDSMLAVGAVDANGTIANFSSRGPTSDGRTKPEVCAQGVATRCATMTSTTSYGNASGTSLSTPLVGGCAAVVLSAHPTWTPLQVREALMRTASNAACPNNIYGWGVIDLLAAINYPMGSLVGDLNYDNSIDVLDVVKEINIVFRGAAYPAPPNEPDITRDCVTNVADVIYLIDYVFRGGPPPPNPAP